MDGYTGERVWFACCDFLRRMKLTDAHFRVTSGGGGYKRLLLPGRNGEDGCARDGKKVLP